MKQDASATPVAMDVTSIPNVATAASANAPDWSDSAENSNSHDDEFILSPQGPSLSYERKIRLHKYAENRARSCLGLLSDASSALWKTIYDLKTSNKFKLFMHRVLGDIFLDAEVLEDLNGTGVYPSANPPRDAREMYKQAAIKWWAIKSGSLVSKSSDFYVLEYIGIETLGGDIMACYLFQESLAEVGGMPHIQDSNLERSQFDAMICKFERTSSPDYKDDFVTISIAFQRPPPMVSLFRSNPAVEMVTQLARGLRDLLEDPSELQEISVVKTSAWVKDKDRRFCVLCNKRFSSIFRRRHHCRTCGEVICWACSSTIRVPSISFTHNDTGKQVLSRHQPSIRVCSKCVVFHHRSKSSRELNNEEDFKDWIKRSTGHQHLAVSNEPSNAQQLRLPSPSHSQDLTGALETLQAKPEQTSVTKEERMPRKYRRISVDNEDEEKEDGIIYPNKHREHPGTLDDRQRRDLTRRSSRKVFARRQRQSNLQVPQRYSYGEQKARGSKHMRRIRRSHSAVSLERATGGSQDNEAEPVFSRNISQNRPTSFRLHGPSKNPTQHAIPTNVGNKEKANRRSNSKERLPLQNSSSYVHVASAWSTNKTEALAMTGAFQELLTKLGGDVHFVVVGFSTGFSAEVVVNLLRQLAPGVPYIGGTIARGMCDENAWVSVNRHNNEGLVTLWGVNDPYGTYSVVHAEYSQSDAHEKSYAAAKTALARVAGGVDVGEKPAFIVTYACPLFVENAIDGIREAIHCPIVGGCSSDATKHGEGEISVSWIQISSSSSTDYTKSVCDGLGDWTEMGIAFALCFPSVETYVSWFSSYSPVGVNSEYCMGTVTKASNKTIYEIDSKPAAEVYQEWLDVVSENSQTDLASIGFPRLGSLHPLGTTIDFVSNQMEIDRGVDANSSSSLCSMQSSDWSKLINMTAVITGINEDGSLSTTSSVASGTNVVLMETSAQSLKTAINKMGAQAVESNKFYIHETIGCLMFLSAGVQALLGHKCMAEMVGAYKDWSGGASLMGMTTFGEIGHLPHSTDFPHYDSLMFGAIIFSKHKRKEFLCF
ncbi:dead deah box rna helicase [Plasmopara halstedii]|uniref:Dead deah box rna helicase n=1 Tax=Plasmopara halstedii TaxID=4781 RepID=A0A0P1A8L2_PLAHL|nr:dead deah box rna helicase [Plasmopara halstedii]CEG37044.1 dead deah box rna helicase [Plasmopara halstedii]|eukprot:XP_024573413.1 dead deah box rna helicase [Plasmopara halstedii]